MVNPSLTIIGATESWTIERLANSGYITPVCNAPYMSGVLLCMDSERRQGYTVMEDTVYDPRNPGGDGGALLAHEFFHLVQHNLSKYINRGLVKSGDPSNVNEFPVWFVEGSADFVGYSVGALAQKASYWDGREKALSYSPPGDAINKNAIEDYENRICCTYPYHIGQIATEFIVASIGFQKMIDIWSEFATTRNFEKSFESVTGISKKTFYEKFEQLRPNVGLPPVTWKLDGVTNKRIGG